MKILKKVVIGKRFSTDEMNALRGGSNLNEAPYCDCNGSTNSTSLCNNNLNSATPCKCSGNNNNVNKYGPCNCQ